MPQFLKRTIESVQKQTLTDWEYIIVDDNDPDTEARKETEKIVEAKAAEDSRIKYLKHEYNKNGAAARNTGLAIAQGEYIAFLDSDDEYMLTRLEKCYDALKDAKDPYGGVYSGCEFRRGGRTYHVVESVPSGNFLVQTLATNFMFCTGSNIFVRRSIIEKLKGFDETFLRHQDYEFLVRFFEHYSLIGLNEPFVIKNNENFNSPKPFKDIEIKKQFLGKFDDILKSLSLKDQDYILHNNCYWIAENAQRAGDKAISKEYYAKSRKYHSFTLKEWLRKIIFQIKPSAQR